MSEWINEYVASRIYIWKFWKIKDNVHLRWMRQGKRHFKLDFIMLLRNLFTILLLYARDKATTTYHYCIQSGFIMVELIFNNLTWARFSFHTLNDWRRPSGRTVFSDCSLICIMVVNLMTSFVNWWHDSIVISGCRLLFRTLAVFEFFLSLCRLFLTTGWLIGSFWF